MRPRRRRRSPRASLHRSRRGPPRRCHPHATRLKGDPMFPIPTFFDPKRAAEWAYRPDAAQLHVTAGAWKAQHAIKPAAADEKRVHLLLLDVQKDFCFLEGSLYVAGRS